MPNESQEEVREYKYEVNDYKQREPRFDPKTRDYEQRDSGSRYTLQSDYMKSKLNPREVSSSPNIDQYRKDEQMLLDRKGEFSEPNRTIEKDKVAAKTR